MTSYRGQDPHFYNVLLDSSTIIVEDFDGGASPAEILSTIRFSPDPFSFRQILSPVTFLSLSNGLISRFLSSTCTEDSGVENIGQCCRLSQLSWFLGAF